MEMELQVTGIEPAIQEKKEEKKVEEFFNVHFATSLNPEQFAELKKLTEVWGVKVETKPRTEKNSENK